MLHGSLMLFRCGVMLSLPVTALVAGGFCWTNQCSKPNRLVRQYGLPPVKLLKGTWMLHVEHFFLASSTDCLEELERHTLHTKLSGSRSKDRCILCCLLAIIWPLQRRVICSLLAGGFRFDRHRVSVGKNLQTQREQIRASVPGGVVKLTFRLLLVESAATFDNSRTFLLSESANRV